MLAETRADAGLLPRRRWVGGPAVLFLTGDCPLPPRTRAHDRKATARPPPPCARAADACFLSISATLSMAAWRMSDPSSQGQRQVLEHAVFALGQRARAVQRAH